MEDIFPIIDLHALAAADGVNLDDALTQLSALYDDIDRRNEVNVRGLDLPCNKGCSSCCEESVFLTPLEFFAIWDHVQTHLDHATRHQIIRDGLAIYARYEKHINAFFQPPPPGESDHFSIAKDVRFRCPYLDPAGACRVYPKRELLGRIFGCSFNDQHGIYGCHLVGAHLADQTVTLLKARPTARRIDDLPLTGIRQVHPWYLHWLFKSREEGPPIRGA